ncbi:hypothetical protein [uncultured Pseudoalteromonas sp.]|uniref:hypothetical protein n=1 Tax=uncultured Pseudoalteromonas sp. TaxID=114053 RepID=UPI000C5217AF|nr:hypothetical protein [uncultured Pseudoalteromonas sp.]MBD55961.1 hypothetical protein [Pseudoalteromonas sp.]|tara:strand:+ start:101 stop:406 length:306 start_codon:yes stop_codon:yes gene_type:complete
MPNEQTISNISTAIVREIPAASIASFVAKFGEEAAKGNCGAGCGSGCCGAACSASPDDLGVFDVYGHGAFTAQELNSIGTESLDALKVSISQKLSNISAQI